MSQFTAFSSRPSAAAAPARASAKTVPIPTPPQSLAEVEQAFGDQPELKKRVYSAIGESPQHQPLFSSISSYIIQLRQAPPAAPASKTNGAAAAAAEEQQPAAKKRKLEGADSGKGAAGAWTNSAVAADFTLPGVSFAIPQRKKLDLQLVGAGAGDSSGGGIRACSAGANVEFGVGFSDVEQIFCLPIPEKPKRQWHFIVVPKNNDGVNAAPEGASVPEQIVWTFQEPTNKELEAGAEAGPEPMAERLNKYLAPFGKSVVSPTKDEFQSTIPQSHRKGELGYHVKAFRGSKEGFLFFTSAGILFGFKKPLMYFSFASVESVSYTSVLQRTFNLNITTSASGPEQKSQEIEYSMVDQADYTGIDQYVKRHGLNDASMAAQRKAQMYNVNGPGAGEEENGAMDTAEDGETELEKAARMLEDEEDEDEEDYDPGSEGDSEGSGSSSDDDDDEDDEDDEEEEDEEGGNLVADELGSEAEDVALTDEE